jgi:hypothetical protein
VNEAQKRREFDEWLALQPQYTSTDPRYEVRRALPGDYPRIYALVDTVFERRRPTAAYDWIYLHNPMGFARGTVVIERASGEIISCTVGFPWPVAHGDTPMRASFGGDNVTVKRLQRTGLSKIRREIGELHPWYKTNIGLGAPNAISRAKGVKLGDDRPLGPLPNATLVVDAQSYLAGRTGRLVARGAGRAANAAAELWHRQVLKPSADYRVESLTRFDSSTNAVTNRCMRSSRYWCPHDAEFLNWRYFDHVLHEYRALALLGAEHMLGYAVFRVSADQGFLMEFAAENAEHAGNLLWAVIGAARESGCNRIGFYATSTWRFWPLLRKAGFIHRDADRYIDASCKTRDDVNVEANWQLLPGDSDVT